MSDVTTIVVETTTQETVEVDERRGPPGDVGDVTWPLTGTPQIIVDIGDGDLDAVDTTDPRLSNPRTPTAHGHTTADVAGLDAALAARVLASDTRLTDARTPTAHVHTTAQVTGLDAALAARPTTVDLGVELAKYSKNDDPRLSDARNPLAHAHPMADVSGLSAALAAKANAASLTTKADLVGGFVPTSQIAAQTSHETVPVQNTGQRLALTLNQVQPGDNVIQANDPGRGTYVLLGTDPSTEASWALLVSPTDSVSSVNNQTGPVILGKGDVGLGNVNNTADSAKPVSTAQAIAIGLKANQSALDSEVTARTDAVTAEATTRTTADTAEATARSAADAALSDRIDLRVLSNDSRLSDPRAAKLIDRGAWAPNTVYAVGDVTSQVGRRWARATPGTSGATFNSANWILLGRGAATFSLLPAGQWATTEHAGSGFPSTVTLAQNAAVAMRLGVGRTCTITGIGFELTAAATASVGIEVQTYTMDPTTGFLSTPVSLGTIGGLDTAGFKPLTGLSIPVTAGDHLPIGLVAKGGSVTTVKRFTAIDPHLASLGAPLLNGVTGWSGTNSASGAPGIPAAPLISVMST